MHPLMRLYIFNFDRGYLFMKKLILVIALALLCVPNILKLTGCKDFYVIDENRQKQKRPSVDDLKTKGFPAINDWYNDNFGMRDVLIRLQHQIDYSLFCYNKSLFIADSNGEEYLFYRSVVESEQILNEQLFDSTKSKTIQTIEDVRNELKLSGIDFKFFIAPQKNEILELDDDALPVKRPENNALYRMEEAFKNGSLKDNYVSVIDNLKLYNKKAPVYGHVDFHWNDWGAAVGFGTLLNDYAKDMGMGKVYDIDSLKLSTVTATMNGNQMSNLSPLIYKLPEETTAQSVKEYTMIDATDLQNSEMTILQNTGTSVFDKAVLFMGDSYTPPGIFSFNETNSGITQLFPKVYYLHLSHAKGILKNMPDDVGLVVVENIESNMYMMTELYENLK